MNRIFLLLLCVMFIVGSRPVQAVAKGRAIAIGVNRVDPARYPGTSVLRGCVNDANAMAAIAASKAMEVKKFLDGAATRGAVLDELSKAARELVDGDLLVVSFSGHGSSVREVGPAGDEDDGRDETWCLYDRMVLDDELGAMWTSFKPGVRIVVFSDSCHSGSVTKFKEFARMLEAAPVDPVEDDKLVRQFENLESRSGDVDPEQDPLPSPVRALPEAVADEHYQQDRAFYDDLGTKLQGEGLSKAATTCTVILISGCQDDEPSWDTPTNGKFTAQLLQTWANGSFAGDYPRFHQLIRSSLQRYQSPNYYVIGASNPAFEKQKPWTVEFTSDGGGGGGTDTPAVAAARAKLREATAQLEAALKN